MESKVNLTPSEWDWLWYWVTCYECPEPDDCQESKPCLNCKRANSILIKWRGVK